MFLFMFGIVICIFIYLFIDEGKICINKEEPKKKKNLSCISIYDWVCDLCLCGCDF